MGGGAVSIREQFCAPYKSTSSSPSSSIVVGVDYRGGEAIMGGGAVSIREQFGAPYKSTSSSSPSSSSVVVGVDHEGWGRPSWEVGP